MEELKQSKKEGYLSCRNLDIYRQFYLLDFEKDRVKLKVKNSKAKQEEN